MPSRTCLIGASNTGGVVSFSRPPAGYFHETIIASPLLDLSQHKPLIIITASNGVIAALDADTDALDWKIFAPVPEGQQAQLVSTPVMIGNKLVIHYQALEVGVRTSHRMAVVNTALKQLDEGFQVLVFQAEKPGADANTTVKFNPQTAFSHAALKHTAKSGDEFGIVYASFGNAGIPSLFTAGCSKWTWMPGSIKGSITRSVVCC